MTRLRYDGLDGTLGASLSSGATSITFSAALSYDNGTPVPTLVSPDYFVLSILDSSGELSEIVWVTAYTAAGTTATIVRGQEGTPGVAHSNGDDFVHAPTARDLESLVGDSAAGPPLSASASSDITGFSVPNNAVTNVPLVNLLFDTGGLYDSGTDSFIITEAGVYVVTGIVNYSFNATGGRAVEIFVNGSQVAEVGDSGPGASSCLVAAVLELAVGDQIQMRSYQNSGGTLALGATDGSRMSVIRVLGDISPSRVLHDFADGTTGPTTIGTSFMDVDTTSDVSIPAAVGDDLSVWFGAIMTPPSTSAYIKFDFHILVAGSPVRTISNGSGGVDHWQKNPDNDFPGWSPSPKIFKVQPGDVDTDGKVHLRVISGTTAGTRPIASISCFVENLGGSGSNGGLNLGILSDHAKVTGGDIALGNTAGAATLVSSGFDVSVPAVEGDILEYAIAAQIYDVTNPAVVFDAFTYVAGSPVNSFAMDGGAGMGYFPTWGADQIGSTVNSPTRIAGGKQYVVQAGDIEDGVVTVRLYFFSFGSSTLRADNNPLAYVSVKNLGQV